MNTKLYIPKKILTLLIDSDYKRKDDLYVILDSIYRKQTHLPSKLFKDYLFVELSNKYLSYFISSPQYIIAAIKYLETNGFIIVNNKYSTGSFSKSYKISSNYLGNPKMIEVTDKGINKRFNEYKDNMKKIKVENNELTKKKYFKEFQLDNEAAIAATVERGMIDIKELCSEMNIKASHHQIKLLLENSSSKELSGLKSIIVNNTKFLSILHRMMSHQMSIRAINDGFLYFKRNTTNGRLDSNLSNLPSYLRKFIRSDKNLFNLDIKNSQPYFLYCTLKNETWMIDKDELEKFKSLVVNGELYDFMSDKWNDNYPTRKNRGQAKEMIFKILFSNVTSYQKYKELFASEFPTIMEWINYKNADNNSTVANMMTMKESFTILDVIKPKLSKLGIEPYTIHDSFVCSEDELPVVKSVVLLTCIEMFGIAPSLHELNIFDECEEEYEYDEDYDFGDGFNELFKN